MGRDAHDVHSILMKSQEIISIECFQEKQVSAFQFGGLTLKFDLVGLPTLAAWQKIGFPQRECIFTSSTQDDFPYVGIKVNHWRQCNRRVAKDVTFPLLFDTVNRQQRSDPHEKMTLYANCVIWKHSPCSLSATTTGSIVKFASDLIVVLVSQEVVLLLGLGLLIENSSCSPLHHEWEDLKTELDLKTGVVSINRLRSSEIAESVPPILLDPVRSRAQQLLGLEAQPWDNLMLQWTVRFANQRISY